MKSEEGKPKEATESVARKEQKCRPTIRKSEQKDEFLFIRLVILPKE